MGSHGKVRYDKTVYVDQDGEIYAPKEIKQHIYKSIEAIENKRYDEKKQVTRKGIIKKVEVIAKQLKLFQT